MSENTEKDIIKNVNKIKKGMAKHKGSNGLTDFVNPKCPMCRHPARDMLTQVYYENGRNIDAARQWFSNKFKRGFKQDSWDRHFKDHVDPFVKGHELVKKKKLTELMDRTAEAKTDNNVSPVSMIKQMLFDCMIDTYISKPTQLDTKSEKNDFSTVAKNLSTLAKTYKEYQQMEMDILAYGKTEDEQRNIMKNYMSGAINNLLKMFSDNPEAQEKISNAFGIINVNTDKTNVEVEIE